MLGAIRAVAQSISYEVGMATLLLCPLLLYPGFEVGKLVEVNIRPLMLCLEGALLWRVRVLAETNRAPFDFVEGESELVAGYHVEIGGFLFALIALREYGSIILISVITQALFFSASSPFISTVIVVGLRMGFVLIRAVLPRYRYDMLIDFC